MLKCDVRNILGVVVRCSHSYDDDVLLNIFVNNVLKISCLQNAMTRLNSKSLAFKSAKVLLFKIACLFLGQSCQEGSNKSKRTAVR